MSQTQFTSVYCQTFPDGTTKHHDVVSLVNLLKTESSVRVQVAKVIGNLARKPEHANAICEAGGIQALIEVLPEGPSSPAVIHTYAALGMLATHSPACRSALMESGIVPHLVRLLRAGSAVAMVGAAILGSLAIGDGTIEHNFRDTVRDAGGIGMLVQLLTPGVGYRNPAKESAIAAAALGNLAIRNPTNQDLIRSEGGVKLMVDMLREEHNVVNQDVAKQVPGALRNLAANNLANKHAIHTAGGVALLMGLVNRSAKILQGEEPMVANWTVNTLGALCNLASDRTICGAIVDHENGIRSLITFLSVAEVSDSAARTLALCLRYKEADVLSVAEEVGVDGFSCSVELLADLRCSAERQLDLAEASGEVKSLDKAIQGCEVLGVPAAKVSHGRTQLEELKKRVMTQQGLERFGLGTIRLPAEFICPITCNRMTDPVVASDGYTYEKSAIKTFLAGGNITSPITRQPLEPGLFPNRALLHRINGFEKDLLAAAKISYQVGVDEGIREKRGRNADEATGTQLMPPRKRWR
jgi:hypothetical protein